MPVRTVLFGVASYMLFSTPSAVALTQSWRVTGEIESINSELDEFNITPPDFAVGDAFVHEFTIDDSTPGVTFPGLSGFAVYDQAVVASRVEIPSRGFQIDWTEPGFVLANNGTGPRSWWLRGIDTVAVSTLGSLGTTPTGQELPFEYRLELEVPEGVYGAPDTTPPMVQPDPAWTPLDTSISWGDSYELVLSIDRFEAVPEPASLSLVALGGLACLRRRRWA